MEAAGLCFDDDNNCIFERDCPRYESVCRKTCGLCMDLNPDCQDDEDYGSRRCRSQDKTWDKCSPDYDYPEDNAKFLKKCKKTCGLCETP